MLEPFYFELPLVFKEGGCDYMKEFKFDKLVFKGIITDYIDWDDRYRRKIYVIEYGYFY